MYDLSDFQPNECQVEFGPIIELNRILRPSRNLSKDYRPGD